MNHHYNMFVLIILTLSYSVLNFASESKPWTIFRKKDDETKVQEENISQDLLTLFALMDTKSQVRQICCREALDGKKSYECKNLADLLFCYKPGTTKGHKSYCELVSREPIRDDKYWHEAYYIKCIGDKHNLSPQQTAQEINMMIETAKKLSGE